MRIIKGISGVVIGFSLITIILFQLNVLVLGVYPQFVQHQLESIQELNPDIRYQITIESGNYSNTTYNYNLIQDNISLPTDEITNYLSHELRGIYTGITVNGTYTWSNSSDYWPGVLIGLDQQTLNRLKTELQARLPQNDSEVILIRDRKDTYLHTEYQIADRTQVFASIPFHAETWGKKELSISSILEFDFSTDINYTIGFPSYLPMDLFMHASYGGGLVLVTSVDFFHTLYNSLQNPPRVNYVIFRHLWINKSLLNYNNLKPFFNNVNIYIETVLQQTDFYFKGMIAVTHTIFFSLDILNALNRATEGYNAFISTFLIFGLPVLAGTILFSDFLVGLQEKSKEKENKLLVLRGVHPNKVLLQKSVYYIFTSVFSIILGLSLGIISLEVFKLLIESTQLSFSLNDYRIAPSLLISVAFLSLALCLGIGLFRSLRITFKQRILIQQDFLSFRNEYLGYFDVILVSIGIFAILGEYCIHYLLPDLFQTNFLFESFYIINFIGFFCIFSGFMLLIERIVVWISKQLPKATYHRHGLIIYQFLILIRQKKHYIRLLQILTFLFLYSQTLIVYQYSIMQNEENWALIRTGAEGFIDSPIIPEEVKDFFHISASTPILSVRVNFKEGYFRILGIDPETYFDIAYQFQKIDNRSINTLKTVPNGVFYQETLVNLSPDSILSLTYVTAETQPLEQINFSLIRTFQKWYTNAHLVMNINDLRAFLDRISFAYVEDMMDGSLVLLDEQLFESSVREFQGYNLAYYQDEMDLLSLDIIAIEVFSFLLSIAIIAIASLISIFYYWVSSRQKELSLEQILGVKRTFQYFTLEMTGFCLLLLTLIYSSIGGILAAICLIYINPTYHYLGPFPIYIPFNRLLISIGLILFGALLSIPFKLGIYRNQNLYLEIRKM
ncbi:MAG: hypothetical protein EAX86_09615 [Candidatus Heimdallarchaeota archaeon]|nr:hypothetical protein [Candidatus Heimdallarchaeota archaeon]